MGYCISWIVCTPGEFWHEGVRLPSVTCWKIEHVLRFGHVTRVEKLEDNPERHEWQAAAICLNTWVLHKLKGLYGEASPERIAPPILDHTLGRHGSPKRTSAEAWLRLGDLERGPARNNAQGHVLDLGMFTDEDESDVYRSSETQPEPPIDYYDAQRHNEALANWLKVAGRMVREAQEGRQHMLVSHRWPYLWIPAGTVADWLQEAEDRNSNCWTEVVNRPTHLARFRAVRALLRELGPTDAHILFAYN